MTPVLHVSSRYPALRHCAALVLPLARHPAHRVARDRLRPRRGPDALLALEAG
jgi:exodeoxyribonuclease-1